MAFPRSQRFVEKETCAPPPTAYHLPSTFDENNCSAWVRPCTFDHQCGQYVTSCSKKHDLSLQSSKSNEAAQAPSCMKQRACASSCSLGNKENVCYFPRKDGTNIPRFKKNVNTKLTDPKAPSFMTRPRHSTHNCFANTAEDPDTSLQMFNFNRHSLKRKSVRLSKQKKENSSEHLDNASSPSRVLMKPSLDKGKLNVSYTIPDKNSDNTEDANETGEVPATSSNGAIPKKRLSNITDDMKETESMQDFKSSSSEDNTLCTNNQLNPNLEMSGSVEKKILDKNNSLREFLNNLDDTDLSKSGSTNNVEVAEEGACNKVVSSKKIVEGSAKKVITEMENAIGLKKCTERDETILKSYDLSPDVESHVVFLITDEFIDDEYDSYVKGSTLEQLHTTEEADLFQICNALIRIYLEKLTANIPKGKVANKMKSCGSRKLRKNIYKDNGKILKKKKNNSNNRDIWSEVEKIVKSALTDLKGEFKNEIYKKTQKKVDGVMSRLERVLLKAEESIESRCERTTVELINKLEKIVN